MTTDVESARARLQQHKEALADLKRDALEEVASGRELTLAEVGRFESGGRAAEPSREAPQRTRGGGKGRKGIAEGHDFDPTRPSRYDAPAPRVKRAGDGRGGKGRERATGNRGGSASADRQDAGQETLLGRFLSGIFSGAQEQDFNPWPHLVASFRRALLYAGFDLRGDARGLTEHEIERYKPDVIRFIGRVGTVADLAVTHSNKDHTESDIFTFDEKEADDLATIYLKRAAKIGWMAEVARQVHHVEDIGDAARVADIFGKRFLALAMFYPTNGGFKLWLR